MVVSTWIVSVFSHCSHWIMNCRVFTDSFYVSCNHSWYKIEKQSSLFWNINVSLGDTMHVHSTSVLHYVKEEE